MFKAFTTMFIVLSHLSDVVQGKRTYITVLGSFCPAFLTTSTVQMCRQGVLADQQCATQASSRVLLAWVLGDQ
eukprot:4656718-Amphidinium_carterae.1